ncbi:hypothetical protein Q6A51_08445 [Pseudomonas sp. KFB-139]|uniref:Uncharacterized protein n=1 Tax=Pseudomonas serbiensis TaxID=3064350 RepID=A0ABT9CMS7_9PSED|nr:hypothetical protein [Pseudomonas sp. KFB-138]MDO7926802.1 hypothetical protein [Pseudomonas sp. KFB-138]
MEKLFCWMICAEQLENFTEHPFIESMKCYKTCNWSNQKRKAILKALGPYKNNKRPCKATKHKQHHRNIKDQTKKKQTLIDIDTL